MIKFFLIAATTIFLCSCTQVNSNGEKTLTHGGDTLGDVDITLSKMDLVDELSKIDEPVISKLIFTASGIEPGWFAEIYSNKLRLVVDYAKDSLIVEETFENLNNTNGYSKTFKITKQEKYDLTVNLINKPCTDAGSGDVKDRQVIISYKGKKYSGCGSFIK